MNLANLKDVEYHFYFLTLIKWEINKNKVIYNFIQIRIILNLIILIYKYFKNIKINYSPKI